MNNELLELNSFTVDADWTDDCQGKKDYDGDIIVLTTRYWPIRYMGTKHSATAKIAIRSKNFNTNYTSLVRAEFEGDTEEEVKTAVEKWAEQKYQEVIAILIKHFLIDGK